MVKTFFRTVLPAVLWLGFISTTGAKELAEYRVGDRVAEDIVTPVALMVVDPAATDAFKEKEAQRLPLVFRYDKTLAAAAERELRTTFTVARSNFTRLMFRSFHLTRLEEYDLETEEFVQLQTTFQKQNPTFPLSVRLAEEWALGLDGFAEQIMLIARVRLAMEQPIRYDTLTNAPKPGGQVLLVPGSDAREPLTLEDLKSRGVNLPNTHLLTLSEARQALQNQFGPDDEATGKFAARGLRVNCFVETDLTLAARARHTEPLFVADDYQAGQVVARTGQRVDRKILAALNQIQEKTMAGRLQQQVAHEQAQTAKERAVVSQVRESNQRLRAGLIAAGALLLISVTALVLRRRAPTSLLPAVISNAATTGSTAEGGWQQRALLAEENAARAQDALRSGVVAQLKEQAVSSLVSQRSDLLEAQRAAAAEMAELERRLTELHAPLQDRLRAYESRIADLERALAAKGAENRELIRAKIELMRQQLEVERSGSQVQFN